MAGIFASSSAFPPPRLHSPDFPTPPSSSTSPPHLLPTPANLTFKSNFYDVLRLKQSASQTEIKAAYRTLAKRFHPDAMISRPGAAPSSSDDGMIGSTDFIQIQRAYATLSDPPARAAYDRSIRRFHVGTTTTRRWETEQCW